MRTMHIGIIMFQFTITYPIVVVVGELINPIMTQKPVHGNELPLNSPSIYGFCVRNGHTERRSGFIGQSLNRSSPTRHTFTQ